MKFLVDAQLPKSLSDLINEKGYDCLHTSELPLKNLTPDSGIIAISKNDKRIVITKDSDFYHSYILKKVPFKILFVRVGKPSIDKFDRPFRPKF